MYHNNTYACFQKQRKLCIAYSEAECHVYQLIYNQLLVVSNSITFLAGYPFNLIFKL
jgi:hypothetical protein